MTREWTAGTDTGLGLAIAAVVLAGLGALAMAVGAAETLAAWGFAGALLGGAVAVWAVHAFPD